MYSAVSFAYLRSMASLSIPMAKVFIGVDEYFWAMAQTREESRPPESRNPTFASETSLFSTPAISFCRIFEHAVSLSSLEYEEA